MQTNWKSIVSKIYQNIWGKAGICTFFALVWYLIRKDMIISDNAITMINIGIGLFLLLIFYQTIKDRKFPIFRSSFIVLFGFITNQFYISEKFYTEFHIELKEAYMYGAVIGILCIIVPIFLKIIKKILKFIVDIIIYCIEQEQEKKRKEKENQKNDAGKRKRKLKEMVMLLLTKEETQTKDVNTSNGQEHTGVISIPTEPQKSTNDTPENEKKKSNRERIAFWVILLIMIIAPIVLIFTYLKGVSFPKVENIELINMLIPLMLVIICIIIVCAMELGVIFKLAHTLVDMFFNRNRRNYYYIYVGVFLLISAYISNEHDYTMDDVINTIAEGNIFSFPLILIIVLPIFLIFMESIWGYFETEKIKKEIVNLIGEMALGIVMSLLKYVSFVTSDFLSSIVDIVEEDLHDDKEKKMSEIEGEKNAEDKKQQEEENGNEEVVQDESGEEIEVEDKEIIEDESEEVENKKNETVQDEAFIDNENKENIVDRTEETMGEKNEQSTEDRTGSHIGE